MRAFLECGVPRFGHHNPSLAGELSHILACVLTRFYRSCTAKNAGASRLDEPASPIQIHFIQSFGFRLNLHLHLHAVVSDGGSCSITASPAFASDLSDSGLPQLPTTSVLQETAESLEIAVPEVTAPKELPADDGTFAAKLSEGNNMDWYYMSGQFPLPHYARGYDAFTYRSEDRDGALSELHSWLYYFRVAGLNPRGNIEAMGEDDWYFFISFPDYIGYKIDIPTVRAQKIYSTKAETVYASKWTEAEIRKQGYKVVRSIGLVQYNGTGRPDTYSYMVYYFVNHGRQ